MNHSEEELIKRGRAAKDVLQALSLEHVWDYISAISEKGSPQRKQLLSMPVSRYLASIGS